MLTVVYPSSITHGHTQEKRKYELVTGQWKSTDEIISIYTELLTSHPGVMGFIDPLHPKVNTHTHTHTSPSQCTKRVIFYGRVPF